MISQQVYVYKEKHEIKEGTRRKQVGKRPTFIQQMYSETQQQVTHIYLLRMVQEKYVHIQPSGRNKQYCSWSWDILVCGCKHMVSLLHF